MPTTTERGTGFRVGLALIGLVAIAALVTASAVAVSGGSAAEGGLPDRTVEVIADPGVPDEVLVTRTLLKSSSSAVVVASTAAEEDLDHAV